MEKSIRRILMAQDWAHHHTALVLTGIFLSGFMAFWQLFVPHMETHASYTPGWCDTNSGSIDIPLTECQGLEQLYVDTNGDQWNNGTNRFQSTTICGNWFDIQCTFNPSASIRYIALSQNNLQGSADLRPFPNLQNLILFGNQINTVNITGLPYLTEVSLDTNQISSIDFSGSTGVEYLYLSNNALTTIDVSNLTNLSELFLYNNQLSGAVLDSISNAHNLARLYLDNNNDLVLNLETLQSLTGLQRLSASQTMVQGDFDTLSGLTALTTIDLKCTNMSELCHVYGTLDTVSGMSGLSDLQLESLGIGGGLDAIYDKYALQYLNLGGTALSGSVSSGFDNLTGLIWINLGDNHGLTGPLPTLSGFTQLTQLHLGNAHWVGAIPNWGDLVSLQQIKLGNTSFQDTGITGTLPSSWGDLSGLQILELFALPGVTGTLPSSWGNLSHLINFKVMYTNVSGPIPDLYQNFLTAHPMDSFNMNNNHLDGPIPTWFDQINYGGKIESNCLDTDVFSGVLNTLDSYFEGWQAQSNCIPDLRVHHYIAQSGAIHPGDMIDYYITYENVGSQKSPNLVLSQSFGELLNVISTSPNGSGGIAYADYFTGGDQCFTDMMHNGTGPYADYMASTFMGYNPQRFSGTETLTQVSEIMFAGDGDVAGGANAQFVRDIVNDQSIGSGGAVVSLLCFTLGGAFDQSAAQVIYNNLGTQCLQGFLGLNAGDIGDETCGGNQIPGYVWNIGDVAVGGSGTIHIVLQVPANASSGQEFTTQTFLRMDGENQSNEGDQVSFQFVVTQPQNTPPAPQHNSGGGGGGIYTDTDKGICELRDCSDSSYDQSCGVCPATTGNTVEKIDTKSLLPDGSVVQNYLSTVSDTMHASVEQIAAFLFGKAAGLTTAASYELFRPTDGITRGEFAKFIDGFVENVLSRKPDASRLRMCSQYADVNASLGDLQLAIYKACMHKVMGLQNDGTTPLAAFNPSAVLTRKDVVTTIDRIINGDKNDNADPYYKNHMAAMYTAGLISVTEPDMVEQRINALMMFNRIVNKMDVLFK